MSRNNKITATLAGTLAALALGGSTAGAMPLQGPQEYDAGHASMAQEQAATQAAARPSQHAALADLRGADAKDAAVVRNQPPAAPHVLAGPPQFPTAVSSSLHSTQAPVNDDDGIPVLTIVLGAFGAVLIGGGAAFAVAKSTRSRRARVTA
jgi:hypothetical protein